MNEHGEYLMRAERLHEQALVIDTHCDTTQRLLDETWDITRRHDDGHVDLPRIREGGIDAMFFAVYAPQPTEPGAGIAAARRQIECVHRTLERHAGELAGARTAEQICAAREAGRVAIVLAIEGGYLIEDSLDVLREYHRAGAAYLTLTHAFHTSWADSSGVHEALTPHHGGLTDFGRDVIRELNRLGMMVDVSHVSDDTVRDVLETSTAPIIASHSSCRAVSPHCRNLSDELMKAIAATGGVVQINFAAAFIDPDHPPLDPEAVKQWWADLSGTKRPVTDHVTPLSVLADHFDHALKLVSPRHVGIGSDFDGVPSLPAGMGDCSWLPHLTAELLRRGYSEQDLTPMLGENVLRVMEACRGAASDA